MIFFPHLMLRLAERRPAGAAEDKAAEPAPDPDILLDHIAEVSKNARATWFGLLGLLVFVGVTLLAHKDADFFAYGAETALPLIGITVPVKAFFYTAPVLVAALYIYLQLYLLNLWDALAEAPARVDGQPLSDRVFPWLISHAALWYRNWERTAPDGTSPEGSASPRPMGRFVVWISIALGALFGPFVLVVMWVRSMPAHDEWLTLWIVVWLFVAMLVGITGMVSAARRMGGAGRAAVSRAHGVRRGWSAVFALLLVFVSWDTTEGGFLAYRVEDEDGKKSWRSFIPLYPANLREAVLTPRPDDWQPFDRWIEGFEKAFRTEKKIESDEALPIRDYWAAAGKAWSARLAGITAPTLRFADLRNADMRGAFLPVADLRGARLDGASLFEAQFAGARLECWDLWQASERCTSVRGADLRLAEMQGADLKKARMQGADFWEAQMQGADLRRAQMQGADLREAQMQGAYLGAAKMQGAYLGAAKMQGSNLWWAQMQGADLSRAEMQGAVLGKAQMQGADLTEAKMQGADLREAQMQGAYLGAAKMQGAVLWDANLEDAICASATLRGALAQSAILTCQYLLPRQLSHTVGDSDTVLPPDLTVVSCLETLPEDVREALGHHPEEGGIFRSSRADVEKALLCGRDEAGNPIKPERVGRSVEMQK